MAGDDPASALYAGVDEAVKERYFAVRRVKRAIRPILMAKCRDPDPGGKCLGTIPRPCAAGWFRTRGEH